MLAPDPPFTFYTVTVTLAEVTGPASKRLARRVVVKTLEAGDGWGVLEAVCEAVAESYGAAKGPGHAQGGRRDRAGGWRLVGVG